MDKLAEQFKNEILSDNTDTKLCEQCKACLFWDGGDAYSNKYDKACCSMYPYPGGKPLEVVSNTGLCKYREVD